MAEASFRQIDPADREERRMTARLAREWVSLKRQNRYASINHLNPTTFTVGWEWGVLVRSVLDGDAPTKDGLEFEFVGRGFHEDAPSCVAGTRLAAVPDRSRLRLATDVLPPMFERQTAILSQGILAWGDGRAVRFRAIALPFCDSSGKLKYGFGAFSHLLAEVPPEHPPGTTEIRAFRDGTWHPLDAARR
jgi:hypothetical protein